MTSNSEVGSSEEDEQFESIIAHRERRSNAGARMRRLVDMEKAGEAELEVEMEEEDKDVDLLFQEDDNDEEFTEDSERETEDNSGNDEKDELGEEEGDGSDSEKMDLDENFSSDTELSSSGSESDESAGERELQKEEKLRKRQARKRALEVPSIKPSGPSSKKRNMKHSSNFTASTIPKRRKYSTRKSTVKKTEAVMKRWKKSQEKKKHMKPVHKEVYIPKTLQERLEEAKITEKENTLSLNQYFEREEARKRRQKELAESRKPKMKEFIRFYSSAVYFTPNEEVEEIEKERLRQERIEKEKNKKKRSGRRRRKKTPSVAPDGNGNANKKVSENLVDEQSKNHQTEVSPAQARSAESKEGGETKPIDANAYSEKSKHMDVENDGNSGIINDDCRISRESDKATSTVNEASGKRVDVLAANIETVEHENEHKLEGKDDVCDAFNLDTKSEIKEMKGEKKIEKNTGAQKVDDETSKGICKEKDYNSGMETNIEAKTQIQSEVGLKDKLDENLSGKAESKPGDKVNQTDNKFEDRMNDETENALEDKNKVKEQYQDKDQDKDQEQDREQNKNQDQSKESIVEPKLIYEGPSQYVAVNYVSFEKFPKQLTQKDIKTALFGKQSTLPAERRDPHFTNICVIRQDNSTDLSLKRLKENREASLKDILKLPRFGEKYKVVEKKKEEKQKAEVKINITTPAPVGIYLPNGKRKECPISGDDATYYDPGSGVPYSSVECFKILQKVAAGKYYWAQIDDGGVNSQFKGGIGCYMGETSGRHAKGVPEGF